MLQLLSVFFTQDTEMEENDMESTARLTEKPNSSMQESLESEVIPDPMEGEQTWPTEEELAEGKKSRRLLYPWNNDLNNSSRWHSFFFCFFF